MYVSTPMHPCKYIVLVGFGFFKKQNGIKPYIFFAFFI